MSKVSGDSEAPVHRLGIPDFIICFLTLSISISIGLYHAIRGRQNSSIMEYFVGNRNFQVLPVALSLAVSFLSSNLVIGIPSEIYHYGVPHFIFGFSVGIGTLLSSWIAVPLWFRLNITSSYEYLEMRYKSRLVRMVGSALGILQNVIYSAVVLIGPGVAVQAVTGFPISATICILSFAAILYTTIGGFTAVIWVDVFQLFIMALGLVTVFIKSLVSLENMQEFWENAVAGKRIRMIEFNPDPTIRTSFWSALFGGVVLWFGLAFTQQSVQRIASIRTISQAKRVFPWSTPVFYLFMLLALIQGLFAYGYYAKKGCDPFVEGAISNPDSIMPYYVMELCQDLPGIPGLFVASVFSASLSSISSNLNSISAMVLSDFVLWFRPRISDRHAKWTAKFLVVLFGVLSMGLSFLISALGGRIAQLIGAFIGSVVGPNCGLFLLSMFFPWVNVKGAVTGIVTGLSLTFWIAVSGSAMVKIPGLPPAPSDRCWFNQTFDANSSQTILNGSAFYNTVPVFNVYEDEPIYNDIPYWGSGLDKLYSISFLLYPVLGLLLTVITGLLVSLITGRTDPEDVNPLCISHLVRKRFYSEKDEHQNSTGNNPEFLLSVKNCGARSDSQQLTEYPLSALGGFQ